LRGVSITRDVLARASRSWSTAWRIRTPVSGVLPAIMIAGTTYRVLRLDGATRGPRFLLRSDHGDLFGLYSYGAEPMKLYAVPLIAL
jgi:hypothetical protein